ncbi:hypothetical protein HZA57_09560 [Candidatus Poribacteria bacterium]|nr:hypothetical protein [Candidatus Poribacteria bacterium]
MPEQYENVMETCKKANPNHHLWNNNGTWWFHCTVHLPNYTKERIRRSLATTDLSIAKQRRDEHLRDLARRTDVRLSIRSGRPNQLGEDGFKSVYAC